MASVILRNFAGDKSQIMSTCGIVKFFLFLGLGQKLRKGTILIKERGTRHIDLPVSFYVIRKLVKDLQFVCIIHEERSEVSSVIDYEFKRCVSTPYMVFGTVVESSPFACLCLYAFSADVGKSLKVSLKSSAADLMKEVFFFFRLNAFRESLYSDILCHRYE